MDWQRRCTQVCAGAILLAAAIRLLPEQVPGLAPARPDAAPGLAREPELVQVPGPERGELAGWG